MGARGSSEVTSRRSARQGATRTWTRTWYQGDGIRIVLSFAHPLRSCKCVSCPRIPAHARIAGGRDATLIVARPSTPSHLALARSFLRRETMLAHAFIAVRDAVASANRMIVVMTCALTVDADAHQGYCSSACAFRRLAPEPVRACDCSRRPHGSPSSTAGAFAEAIAKAITIAAIRASASSTREPSSALERGDESGHSQRFMGEMDQISWGSSGYDIRRHK